MKKMLIFLLLFALFSPSVYAAFDPETDYMQEMLRCVQKGETENGVEAAEARKRKIEALGLDYAIIDYRELEMLSKLIEIEAGSCWLPAEWKMAVGEVVLNRMASPEFPDTMLEVIEQPGQYYGQGSPIFWSTLPSAESVIAAKRLLEGERVLCDPGVVFQANFCLGSGVHTTLHDPQLGFTYFCYSSHPELYMD